MAATMEMYKVKPYYDKNMSVSIPNVMYKLNNLHKTDGQVKHYTPQDYMWDPSPC